MFKDYYSILGISFPSNDEEIKRAYNAKIEKLGSDSIDVSNPNYQNREDVEEAYMVLGTSYSLKIAYDEEYQKAIKEGFDSYEIKDDWILSRIEHERCFIKNRRLKQKTPTSRKTGNMGKKALGCLGLIFLVYIGTYLFAIATKSLLDGEKESYTSSTISDFKSSTIPDLKSSTTSEFKESAELKLKHFAEDVNVVLPRDLDENVTTQAVLIEDDALVYVYKVDDTFFAEFKDQAVSREIQLGNLKMVCNEIKPIIDLLIETHRGIGWRYICRESGEITEYKMPYTDLVNLK